MGLARPGRLFLFALMVFIRVALADTPARLPVYIEDSHAGSFYWIIQNLQLQGDYTLVLIDAHSDATQVFDSDAIRRQVLRSATDDQLGPLVQRWRAQGTIQCFNWIEPLIPHPISQVVWIPADELSTEELTRKRAEVREQINAHEMAVPRREGDFSQRYQVTDLARWRRQKTTGPLIVSLDLDAFANDPSPHIRLSETLDAILELENVQALTIAISRPYLASEEQSHQLLFEALRHLTRVVNVDLEYEPFSVTGEDRSLRAAELAEQGLEVPRYQVERAPGILRALLVQNAARIQVRVDRSRWERLLQSWRQSLPRICVEGDGYVPVGQPLRVHLEEAPAGEVVWKALLPARDRYNLTGQNQGYADHASGILRWREVPVSSGDRQLELSDRELVPFLDPKTGWGTLRVFCEVDGRRSNVVCLSRYQGDGYLARLSEIFNLPYVYGSALLTDQGQTSADARCGADCAHFLIYGWRRQGWNVPYLNPGQLLAYLREIDEFSGFRHGLACGRRGPIMATPDLIRAGLVLHFGKHMAAVYDEGLLCEKTRVVHQLETYPELTTLGALAGRYPRVRVMVLKARPGE